MLIFTDYNHNIIIINSNDNNEIRKIQITLLNSFEAFVNR